MPPDQPINQVNDQLPMMPSPKKPIPILPILIAVIVAIALIGALGFFFIQQHTKKPLPVASSTTKTTKSLVTPDDVDKVKSQINQNLNNINDSADFTVDDLSTQKLGGL